MVIAVYRNLLDKFINSCWESSKQNDLEYGEDKVITKAMKDMNGKIDIIIPI